MKNNNEKCPFLEEVVVRYCKAYPVKKMIPMDKLQREDPCIGCPHKCAIYREVAHLAPDKTESRKSMTVNTEVSDYNKQEKVRGFSFHPSVYYLSNHVWVRIENSNKAQVGLDDFALKLLEQISELIMPKPGEPITHISIKHSQHALEIPVKLSGKTNKTNPAIMGNPDLIRQDPYQNWLFEIESENILDDIKNSRRGEAAQRWFEQEADGLQQMLQEECGITLTDGGEIMADWQERVSDAVKEKIIKRFLKNA
jgi:glycine cleavage system H protein